MNSFVVQITYVFKFVDFIILSSRLISQIIAKNDIISIVHPGNASKQWYMCYSQKTENVTEDNQSHVNASRDSLARQFDCRLREWFLKVLSDTPADERLLFTCTVLYPLLELQRKGTRSSIN